MAETYVEKTSSFGENMRRTEGPMKNDQGMYRRSSLGTPGIYDALYSALNPRWLYTAASMANFAQKSGLLRLCNPNSTISERDLFRRARAAFGARRSALDLPNTGDHRVFQSGRWYPAWKGWRWQQFENLKEAEVIQSNQWRRTFKTECKQIRSIEACLREAKVPPEAAEGASDNMRFHRTNQIHFALQITRCSLAKGMKLGDEEYRFDWILPHLASPVDSVYLRPLIRYIQESRVYRISDFLSFAKFHNHVLPLPHDRFLASLYLLAQEAGFPELGDAAWPPGCEPSWTGARWRLAFGDDLL